LLDALEVLSLKDDVAAIVITAPERTFLAGADIKEFGKKIDAPSLGQICDKIEKMNKITIASLHGTPLGGGLEVAMSAHYRIAAPKTKVGLPEVLLGILPGAGGTQRLPRLCGVSMALDMMITGKHVPIEEAFENGIIDEIAIDDKTIENGISYAKKIISQGLGRRPTSEITNKIQNKKDIEESISSAKATALKKYKNLFSKKAKDIMSQKPKTISGSFLINDALHLMNKEKITALVVAKKKKVLGLVHMHNIISFLNS